MVIINDRPQAVSIIPIQMLMFKFRLVDNLPVATRVFNPETKEVQFEHGYRLGQVIKGHTYINNHLKFILSYHMHAK